MSVARLDLDLDLPQIYLFVDDKQGVDDVIADGEIAQGFSWRPTTLTFYVFEECDVTSHVVAEFCLAERAEPSAKAERVIRVPFALGESDRLKVMEVRDSWTADIDVPAGDYCVTFELGHADREASPERCELWARFTFVPGTCEAEIVRADPGLKPPARLVIGKA